MTAEERQFVSKLCLFNIIDTIQNSKIHDLIIVSSDKSVQKITQRKDIRFVLEKDDAGVNPAVKRGEDLCKKIGADASLVIPHDLPLLSVMDIDIMCASINRRKECVVICPSLKFDGTNGLLRRPPSIIETFYDNNSFESHLKIAKSKGVAKIFLSKKMMVDLDTPEDLKYIFSSRLSEKIKSQELYTFLKFIIKDRFF